LQAADTHRRLRFLTPVTAGGADIYVHAKIMVIDDRLLRVGSSNINKRSQDTDTECDLAIEAGIADADTSAGIIRIRDALLTEHLGLEQDEWQRAVQAAGGRLAAAIDAVRRPAGRTLLPYQHVPLDPVELALAETQVADLGPEGFALVLGKHLGPRLRRLVPWMALASGLAAAAVAARVRRRS
jgi:hypothetical protein